MAGFRSGFAALALWALMPEARRRLGARAAAVSLAYAATLVLFVQATKNTTAANAIFLQSTAPFYLLLLSPWLLRERLAPRDLKFMAALAAGMVLLFAGYEPPRVTAPAPRLGNLQAVASGVSWAFTLIGLRRLGREGGPGGLGAVAAGNAAACLACLPWALPLGATRPADWGLILFLGFFQIGLAYRWLTAGLREVPALEAALLLLLEPVLNPLWAWAAHGETVGALSAGGGAVILAATACHSLSRKP